MGQDGATRTRVGGEGYDFFRSDQLFARVGAAAAGLAGFALEVRPVVVECPDDVLVRAVRGALLRSAVLVAAISAPVPVARLWDVDFVPARPDADALVLAAFCGAGPGVFAALVPRALAALVERCSLVLFG